MKKLYAIAITLLVSAALFAQNVDLDGIVWTDLEGNTYDLGALQDEHVIIFDFWATWCGPCIGSVPGLEKITESYGPEGDQTIYLFSVEIDEDTDNEVFTINAHGMTSPVFLQEENVDILNDFDYGNSIPYFVVLCPDGSWQSREGGIGDEPNYLLSLATPCNVTSSVVTDAKIKELEKPSIACADISDTYSTSFVLENIGTEALTSASVEVRVNDEVVETINWTGNLAKFQEESVDLDPIAFNGVGNQTIEVELTSVNGSSDENMLNDAKTIVHAFSFVDEEDITIEIDVDNYPDEIGWSVTDENGTVIVSKPFDTYSGQTSMISEEVELPEMNTCYTVEIVDRFGDGISGGGFRILNSEGTLVYEYNGNYFSHSTSVIPSNDIDLDDLNAYQEGIIGSNPLNPDTDGDGMRDGDEVAAGTDPTVFTVTSILDTELIKSISVYPNPASDLINIQLELNQGSRLSATLSNVLGQTLVEKTLTNGQTSFYTTNMESGLYMITIKSEEQVVATKAISVVH